MKSFEGGFMSEDINIQYQGLHPSHETDVYLRAIMGELLEEAPYGASLKAQFSTKNDVVKGMITIRSVVGPFFCLATGGDLRVVGHQLLNQMRRRLDKWKSKRFNREGVRHHAAATDDQVEMEERSS